MNPPEGCPSHGRGLETWATVILDLSHDTTNHKSRLMRLDIDQKAQLSKLSITIQIISQQQ